MKLKKEKSCGCIIIDDGKVLLVHKINGNYWGFPKGHVEDGETEEQTALREVKEEVGIDVIIDKTKRFEVKYITNANVDMTTVLFGAVPINKEIIVQRSELKNAKWFDFKEALNILTYKSLKTVLQKVINNLKDETHDKQCKKWTNRNR